MNKNNWIWNTVIGVQIVIYIVLTTTIFVLQKKIELLEKGDNRTVLPKTTPNSNNIKKITTETKQVYEHSNAIAAIESYKEKTNHNPNDLDSLFKIGVLYMSQKGQEQKAIDTFNHIITQNPDYQAKKSIELWLCSLEKKKKQSKITQYERALRTLQKKYENEKDAKTKSLLEKQLSQIQDKLKQLQGAQ